MQQKTALVITSISAPNNVLRSFAEGCTANKIEMILIGDVPSPKDFELAGCDFWSLERQRSMPFMLAKNLPVRHYARKNLGYLQAIGNGAGVIIESDDDNFPRPSFWQDRSLETETAPFEATGWVNMYRYFTRSFIWPRGFPLERIHDALPEASTLQRRNCPIQQGLADGDPDVDAIFRLTRELPLDFEVKSEPYSLGKGSWCPFNSQNTTWFREAFPLLYLPSHCSFRMTDIWRSYIAVRICWENDWDVSFHEPTVWQERNEHDLIKDLTDETIGYRNNLEICRRLEALDLKTGQDGILDNMRMCYEEFIRMELIGREEMPLFEAWCQDLRTLKIL